MSMTYFCGNSVGSWSAEIFLGLNLLGGGDDNLANLAGGRHVVDKLVRKFKWQHCR